MKPEIKIRKARQADCPRLMELIQELADYERSPDEVSVALEHFRESGFGENPVWWALVAESNETIIAFALYYIRYSTWKGKRMYLEDIIVTEKSRGLGVGKQLFDRLVEEAKEKKLNGIVWQVLDWNEPAIRFYKKNYNAKLDKGWINCSIEL